LIFSQDESFSDFDDDDDVALSDSTKKTIKLSETCVL